MEVVAVMVNAMCQLGLGHGVPRYLGEYDFWVSVRLFPEETSI